MGGLLDEHLILEFETQDAAEACLAAINDLAAAWWAGRGYTVVEVDGHKELVGKNAATGQDAPDSARTITWDSIKESPDGTFWFSSLSNDRRFYDPPRIDWKERLADAGYVAAHTERPFPTGWTVPPLDT